MFTRAIVLQNLPSLLPYFLTSLPHCFLLAHTLLDACKFVCAPRACKVRGSLVRCARQRRKIHRAHFGRHLRRLLPVDLAFVHGTCRAVQILVVHLAAIDAVLGDFQHLVRLQHQDGHACGRPGGRRGWLCLRRGHGHGNDVLAGRRDRRPLRYRRLHRRNLRRQGGCARLRLVRRSIRRPVIMKRRRRHRTRHHDVVHQPQLHWLFALDRWPRPAIKGEEPMELRLMDDIVVPRPVSAAAFHDDRPPYASPNEPKPSASALPAQVPAMQPAVSQRPAIAAASENIVPVAMAAPQAKPAAPATGPATRMTILVLKSNQVLEVTKYRIDGGQVNYQDLNGAAGSVDESQIDWKQTTQMTSEVRSVDFPALARATN